MKNKLNYLILSSLLFLSGCAVETAEADAEPAAEEVVEEIVIEEKIDPVLTSKVEELIEEYQMFPEDIAVVITSLDTGSLVRINENEQYVAASLYKVPLAMLYYDQVARKERSLDDGLMYLPEHYEDGGYLAGDYALYTEVPLSVLLEYAIQYSDNNAGHVLFENLGGWPAYVEQRKVYSFWAQEQVDDAFRATYGLQEEEKEKEEEKTSQKETSGKESSGQKTEPSTPAEEGGNTGNGETAQSESQQTPAEEGQEEVAEATEGQEEVFEEAYEEYGDFYGDEEIYYLEGQGDLSNFVTASFMNDCLRLIVSHPQVYGKLLADMKVAQPETYLNANVPSLYAQKYGAIAGALNIAGIYQDDDQTLLVTVLSQYEPAAELFMQDLGVLLKDYFHLDSGQAEQQPEDSRESDS